MINLRVSCGPEQAADLLERGVCNSGMSVECVDRYMSGADDGHVAIVLVFEKYFMRNSSRASLTVTVDNLSGRTCVHAIGSGGGQGSIFRFDWGASDNFESSVEDSLREYSV